MTIRRCACVLALALAACGSSNSGPVNDGGSALMACNVDAPTSCPADGPTWETVEPIVQGRCATPCHYGQIDGPWPLHTYQQVVDWYDVVRADLMTCSMPPADGGVSMTDEERHTLLTWLRCDTPK